MLCKNCDLKICDFGLSRGSRTGDDNGLTEYVVTRWWRAPELLLSCPDYGTPIDVWSIGCIFGEMLGRKPVFNGSSYCDQLRRICDLLGPTNAELEFVKNEKARSFVLELPRSEPANLNRCFPTASGEAIDLLRRFLVIDPSKRITVAEALAHPFLGSMRDPDDELELTSSRPIDCEDIESLQGETLTRENLQQLLVQDFIAMRTEDERSRLATSTTTVG